MKHETKRTATESSAVLALSAGFSIISNGGILVGGGLILLGVGLFVTYEKLGVSKIEVEQEDINTLTEVADELLNGNDGNEEKKR